MNEHPRLNNYVIVAGVPLILVGLVFYYADSSKDGKGLGWLVIPFTGVGGSVLATGLTNRILAARSSPLPLHSIFEALLERTKLIRRNHVLTLEFHRAGESVRLTKKHEFILYNPGPSFTKELSMYTDTALWRHEARGGFTRVQEPNNDQLCGPALLALLDRSANGKIYFRKTYRFPKQEGAGFVFYSEEYYRTADRLVWTVEDLSEDFKIYIHNRTGVHNAFALKINHHREAEIEDRRIHHVHDQNHEEIQFEFGSEILPYQGFEIMWDLDPTDDERALPAPST